MREIRRSCEYNLSEGKACGPFAIGAVVAEIVVEDGGKEKYLTMCWINEVSDGVSLEVTDKSIKKYLLDLDESQEELDEIRKNGTVQSFEFDEEYNGEYKEQYKELLKMIQNKRKEEGLMDEEDVWEEE